MKKINFKRHSGDELESILNTQKKKLRRQQIVFSTIFTVVVCFLAYYLVDKYLYAEFDGYIAVNTVTRRAYSPIYITDIKYNEGALVEAGDTLFTYIRLDFFTNVSNRSFGSVVENNYMNALEKTTSISIEINSLKEAIALLEKEITKEKSNVRYGLSTASQVASLNRELSERKNRLKGLELSLAEYANITNDYHAKMQKAGLYSAQPLEKILRYVNTHLDEYGHSVGYGISVTDAFINKVFTSVGSVLLTGEPIMEVQSLDVEDVNLHCEAYVMNNDLTNIYEGKKVEIIVNGDVSYEGVVASIGLYVKELPKEYESTFYRDNKAMLAIIRFKEGTVVSLHFATNNLPVRIRTLRQHAEEKMEEMQIKYTVPPPPPLSSPHL